MGAVVELDGELLLEGESGGEVNLLEAGATCEGIVGNVLDM
jgi:hypothetical protein